MFSWSKGDQCHEMSQETFNLQLLIMLIILLKNLYLKKYYVTEKRLTK